MRKGITYTKFTLYLFPFFDKFQALLLLIWAVLLQTNVTEVMPILNISELLSSETGQKRLNDKQYNKLNSVFTASSTNCMQ